MAIKIFLFDAEYYERNFKIINSKIMEKREDVYVIHRPQANWTTKWKNIGYTIFAPTKETLFVIPKKKIELKKTRGNRIKIQKRNQTLYIVGVYLPPENDKGKEETELRTKIAKTLGTTRIPQKSTATVVVGQLHTRDERWSLNPRPIDKERTKLIREWENRENLTLVPTNKEPTRKRGNSNPATHKAAWTRNCKESEWKVIQLDGLNHKMACIIRIIPETNNCTTSRHESTISEIKRNDNIQENESSEKTLNDRESSISLIRSQNPREQEHILQGIDFLNKISTKITNLKIMAANTLNQSISMKRMEDVAEENNTDILILNNPDENIITNWKKNRTIVDSKNIAIIIINEELDQHIKRTKKANRTVSIVIENPDNNNEKLRIIAINGERKKSGSEEKTRIKTIKKDLERITEKYRNEKIIIIGDINLKRADWADNAKNLENTGFYKAVDPLINNGYTQHGKYHPEGTSILTATKGEIEIKQWKIMGQEIAKKRKPVTLKIEGYGTEKYKTTIGSNKLSNEDLVNIEKIENKWRRDLNKETQNENLKIVQINLQRCKAAMSMLLQYIVEEEIDIVVLTEPHVYPGNKLNIPGRLITSKETNGKFRAAILIVNKNINVLERHDLRTNEACVATIGSNENKFTIVSAYNKPMAQRTRKTIFERNIEETKNLFQDLINIRNKIDNPTVIAGDFNIKLEKLNAGKTHSSPEITEIMEEFLSVTDMEIINTPKMATHINSNIGESTIDLTIIDKINKKQTNSWMIDDRPSCSDHKYIRWQIDLENGFRSETRIPRYDIKEGEHFDILKDILIKELNKLIEEQKTIQLCDKNTIDKQVDRLTETIQLAMKKSKQILKRNNTRKRENTSRNQRNDDIWTTNSTIREIKGIYSKDTNTKNNISKRRKKSAKFWNKEIQALRKKFTSDYYSWKKRIRQLKRKALSGKKDLEWIGKTKGKIDQEKKEWQLKQKIFKEKINTTRTNAFREICNITPDGDIYGKAYKIAFNKYNKESVLTNMIKPNGEKMTDIKEIMKHIIDSNFPNDVKEEDTDQQRIRRKRIVLKDREEYMKLKGQDLVKTTRKHPEIEDELISSTQEIPSENQDSEFEIINDLGKNDNIPTIKEIERLIAIAANRKAPGEDGITVEVIKIVKEKVATAMHKIIESCINIGYFPMRWKISKVVMIPKPGKDPQTFKGWRPICLLDVMAKIFDKLMIGKIQQHMLDNFALNPNQYGFTGRKSTVNAVWDATQTIKQKREEGMMVACIFLDIDGAFDNAWHTALKEKLRKGKCPANWYYLMDNYLKDRRAVYERDGIKIDKTTNKGCPQGSSSGPGIWNIVYDDMLELNRNIDWARIQAYADDGLVIVWGKNREELKERSNEIVGTIVKWGKDNKLIFNPEKTQILAFIPNEKTKGTKRGYHPPLHGPNNWIEVKVGNKMITSSQQVKYLGIWLDNKLEYKYHLARTMEKSKKAMNNLTAMATREWGLTPEITKIIYKVAVETIFTYGCQIWWEKVEEKRELMQKVRKWHRNAVQKVGRLQSGTSREEACLITNIKPITWKIKELIDNWKLKNLPDVKIKTPKGSLTRENLNKTARSDNISDIKIEYTRKLTIGDKEKAWILKRKIQTHNTFITLSRCKGIKFYKGYTRIYNKRDNMEKEHEEVITANSIHEIIDRHREKIITRTKRTNLNIYVDHEGWSDNPDSKAKRILHNANRKAKDWGILMKIIIYSENSETNLEIARINGCNTTGGRKEVCISDNKFRDYIQEKYTGKWTKEWSKAPVGHHARFMLGNPIQRGKLKHIRAEYLLGQVYSGHSKTREYRYKIGYTESPICEYCDINVPEDLEHYILECEQWTTQRLALDEWIINHREEWLYPNNPEQFEELKDINEIRAERRLKWKEAETYDRKNGITWAIKERQLENKTGKRKLRTLIRNEDGHQILKQFLKETGRLSKTPPEPNIEYRGLNENPSMRESDEETQGINNQSNICPENGGSEIRGLSPPRIGSQGICFLEQSSILEDLERRRARTERSRQLRLANQRRIRNQESEIRGQRRRGQNHGTTNLGDRYRAMGLDIGQEPINDHG